MQQTIYGEIPNRKTKVFTRKEIDSFVSENLSDFQNIRSGENCLYSQHPETLIDDIISNYLNIRSDKKINKVLKSVILKEYEKLESIYPKLGNIFIEQFFKDDGLLEVKDDYYVLHRDNVEEFTATLKNDYVVKILKKIIEHSSLEHVIEINQSHTSDIFFKKTNNLNFRIKYDASYLGSKNYHKVKNFRYILIDGRIDSIGEIYHLLYKAAEEKVPYVLFCFGCASEVKDVIIQNNTKGNTEIVPVCMDFNENTINVMRDLQVVLGGDVITAQKGQTISQEVRNDLPVGKCIEFDRTGFIIEPNVKEAEIKKHRMFLENKIKNASNETNTKLLIDRKRRMSSKSLEIYLPEALLKNSGFRVELDYCLRFFSFTNRRIVKVKSLVQGKTYFIPEEALMIVDKNVKSLKNMYGNLDKAIIIAEC